MALSSMSEQAAPKPRTALGTISVNKKAQEIGLAANAAAASKPQKKQIFVTDAVAKNPAAAAGIGPTKSAPGSGESESHRPKAPIQSVKDFVAARRLSKAEKEAAARANAPAATAAEENARMSWRSERGSKRGSVAASPEDEEEIKSEAELFEAEVKLGYLRSAKEDLEAKLKDERAKHRAELRALEARLNEAMQRASLAEKKIVGSVVAAPVPERQAIVAEPVPERQAAVVAQPMRVTTATKAQVTTATKAQVTTGKKVTTATATKVPEPKAADVPVTATVAVPVVLEKKVVEVVERVVEVERSEPPASPNVSKMQQALEAAVTQALQEKEAQVQEEKANLIQQAAVDKERALAAAAERAKSELAEALNAAYKDKMQAIEATRVRAHFHWTPLLRADRILSCSTPLFAAFTHSYMPHFLTCSRFIIPMPARPR